MPNHHVIAFVAGKSGGHIIPALTYAQRYKKENANTHILFFSTHSPLDKKLLQNNPHVHYHINLTLENVPYKKIIRYPLFAYNLLVSFIKSIFYLYRFKPKKLISMGGYISIPVCLAARLLRITIELHELNAVPGKAVRYLSRFANSIVICFEYTKKYLPQHKCIYAAYPVRFDTIQSNTKNKIFNIDNAKKTLLILGGSQGSYFINQAIKQCLLKCPQLCQTITIIHQTGSYDTTNWHDFYKTLHIPAIIFDYNHAINTFYNSADLVICRAGAGTLFETAFFNKKCITIPLETTTTSHQIDNARAIVQQYPHLFTMITQKDIDDHPHLLERTIQQLLLHRSTELLDQNQCSKTNIY